MRITIHRCIHCGIRYNYQASGPEAFEYNDGQYCHGCAKAISKALDRIPRKIELRYRDIKEMPWVNLSLDTVLGWERQWFAAPPDGTNAVENFFGRRLQRIFPGLCDLTTGECEHRREVPGQYPYADKSFQVCTWRTRPNEWSISMLVEWDLINNKWAD